MRRGLTYPAEKDFGYWKLEKELSVFSWMTQWVRDAQSNERKPKENTR